MKKIEKNFIECSQCPKCYHVECFSGIRQATGYTCVRHACHKCGAKTSTCSMLFMCLGCQASYCIDCLPTPHWEIENEKTMIQNNNDIDNNTNNNNNNNENNNNNNKSKHKKKNKHKQAESDDNDNNNNINIKDSDESGMYFVDFDKISRHYGYRLPQNSYMYIFCSKICKNYYETDYSQRPLVIYKSNVFYIFFPFFVCLKPLFCFVWLGV